MTTIVLKSLKVQGKLSRGDKVSTPRLGDCEVIRIHDVYTIDVKREANGACFRLAGLNFGPFARMVQK